MWQNVKVCKCSLEFLSNFPIGQFKKKKKVEVKRKEMVG